MRRALISAALAMSLLAGGLAAPASAAPPTPGPPPTLGPAADRPLPPGWTLRGNQLTWTAPTQVAAGGAAVQFYAGDRLLGRPDPAKDLRSFTLAVTGPEDLADLEVRAAGRRLDAEQPRRRVTAPQRRSLPANPVDPGVRGPHGTVTGEYTLDDVQLPDLPNRVEMKAVVVAPTGVTGQRPLALFLHGRNVTCFVNGRGTQEWPCPAGTQAVPSHRGYLGSQELLASQGYLTVSISANGVNAQDARVTDYGTQARSSLVRQHLARWAAWASDSRTAPSIVRQSPPADLSKVFLVGHSRGGEGVNRVALDSVAPPPGDPVPTRWTILGTLLIAPTAFGQNPAPDVPSVVVLPGCDNDMYDLAGQTYVDNTRGLGRGRALHSSLLVVGANHNHFNSVWSPGSGVPIHDDWLPDAGNPDPVCDPGAPLRLTPVQQQTVAATYVAAAARLFVQGDDQVRPLLDGTGRRALSADPAQVYSQALGGGRAPVIEPTPALGLTNATLCGQVDEAEPCLSGGISPHFAQFDAVTSEPGRYAVAMAWEQAGTPVRLRPSTAATISGYEALALRMFVPPGAGPTRFGVAVTGADGRRTLLDDIVLHGLPATTVGSPYWGQEVRVPSQGVGTVATLELTPRTANGRAWLVDAWGWRPETQTPQAVPLPRVDVGTVTEPEGDEGRRTFEVPVTVTGSGTGRVRFFSVDPDTGTVLPFEAPVTAQTRSIPVPVQVTADTRYGTDRQYRILAKAVSGVVVGDFEGGVVLTNDDPVPTATVTPARQTVAEGESISVEVTLNAQEGFGTYVYLDPTPSAEGPELSTTDVDPDWFVTNAYREEVAPSRPLATTSVAEYVWIEAGQTLTISIPTIVDGVTEPAEHVRARLRIYEPDWRGTLAGPEVTATVVD